ncbi:hypothetical protein [Psychrobacter piscatorii]|uniref:hypothetical protein n=1 Tax=Psychrobacter piscatorii TaxID=554343 RepID=UPI003736DD62
MTDVKQLPENLEQLEQLTEFKRVYKKYTADQIEDLLTEAEVDYLSADNKSELTWRLLDHQGFDFEAALAEANSDQPAPQDEPVLGGDEPVPADDKDDTNEDVQTVQDDADSEHGDQVDSEASADLGSGSASADDSEKPSQMGNVTNDDAPSDIGNSDDANANKVEQPAEAADQPATDSTAPNDEAPTTQTLEQDKTADEQADNQSAWRHPFFNRRNQLQSNTPADEDDKDHVAVFNTGAFNFFETATSTLVPAKETVKIYPTATADKDQILRNVKQYNHTRGNKLRVIN